MSSIIFISIINYLYYSSFTFDRKILFKKLDHVLNYYFIQVEFSAISNIFEIAENSTDSACTVLVFGAFQDVL